LIEPSGANGRNIRRASAFLQRAGERGSLLLEAMVGGAILGVAVISLYGGFSMGFRSVRLSQEDIRANQILVEQLETVRVYDWAKLTGGTFVPTNFTAYFTPPSGTNSAGTGVAYRGHIAITRPPLTESYSNALRQFTVTLNWNSSDVARSRSMTTFVSQNGIQTYKR